MVKNYQPEGPWSANWTMPLNPEEQLGFVKDIPEFDFELPKLDTMLMSLMQRKDNIVKQDNAPCHKAKMGQEWFEVLTWPPNSPDLNPIHHLWDALDKQVRSMEVPPRNLQDLAGSAANILLPGFGLGLLVPVKGTLNASAYQDVLDNFMLTTCGGT
ncbi:hypothetical protein QTP86_010065 [Hemibagrus guttatus]|nr:hypothetical protein QTP86_010065 [Hemibagrus guttatus]